VNRWQATLLVGLTCCGYRASGDGAEQRREDSRAHAPPRVRLTAEGETNAGIVTSRVSPETFGPRLRVPAEIEADPQLVAHVGARVPGRVVALRVALGDRVAIGAPLVEIDAVELHQVTTEYLVAVARARQARDALQRARELVRERTGALQDLRRAEADDAAARATLHEADEHLHFLGLREADIAGLRARTTHGRARSVVRSPVAGIVTRIDVALGQVVTGEEVVAVVARLDRVWATLRVFERDVEHVRPGVRATLETAGRHDAVALTGTVSFVSSVVDRETRTIAARVPIENAHGDLRPGMSAVGILELPSESARVWLPRESVQVHDGQSVVFVRVGDREFEVRAVRVGDERAGRVEILAGIGGPDEVVVRGAFSLLGEVERSELEEDG